jgi:hypothetical protein
MSGWKMEFNIGIEVKKWCDFKDARKRDPNMKQSDPKFMTMLKREELIDELFRYLGAI